MGSTVEGTNKKAMKYCLRLLSSRPRSECEIDRRLEAEGYEPAVRKSTLDTLRAEGLVGDEAFTLDWIDSRVSSNPRSSGVIRQELIDKGVSSGVIEEAFSKRIEVLDDRKIATGMVENRMGTLKPGNKMKDKARLYRYLVGKGFEPELAEEVVEKVIKQMLDAIGDYED